MDIFGMIANFMDKITGGVSVLECPKCGDDYNNCACICYNKDFEA